MLSQREHPLAQLDGPVFVTAGEVLLKGLLESDVGVDLLCVAIPGAFDCVVDAAGDTTAAALLSAHGTELRQAADGYSALASAITAAGKDRNALVLIPADQMPALIEHADRFDPRRTQQFGALAVFVEDIPGGKPASCPRQLARALGWPCIEPIDLSTLKDAAAHAIKVSRAATQPTMAVIHRSLLRTVDTIVVRANRVLDRVDAVMRGRTSPRVERPEPGGVMRVARRLELNRARGIPSPGERSPLGVVTIGAADASFAHLLRVLGLTGRVPTINLGLIHPIDSPLIERLLGRCERVVVLEPRPSTVEASVHLVAEQMREKRERPALVCGRLIPREHEAPIELGPDAAVHPSMLARAIVHLLHTVRPGLNVAAALADDPPADGLPDVPERGAGLGVPAAAASMRALLTDVDQWLRDHGDIDSDHVGQHDGAGSIRTEVWEDRRFLQHGRGSFRALSRSLRPAIVVVCAVDIEAETMVAAVRGAADPSVGDRLRVQTMNITDVRALRDAMRAAALLDGLTVFVVVEQTIPQFSVSALESQCAEIDKLGYEPRQEIVLNAEVSCAVGPPSHQPRAFARREPAAHTELTITRIPKRLTVGVRGRIQPLIEQVEVVRTEPPVVKDATGPGNPLAPMILHANQSSWRIHIAGFRGHAPGAAATALCETGRLMGYHVQAMFDPTPIGPGLRAWSQVTFSRPRRDGAPQQGLTRIPYAEADVLLGIDADEAIRATSPQWNLRVASAERTAAVVDIADMLGGPDGQLTAAAALRRVTHEGAFLSDISESCHRVFRTDRVRDLVLLGIAYQRGLVPVDVEAMEAGIRSLDQIGIGRALDAFRFGRSLTRETPIRTTDAGRDHEAIERFGGRAARLVSLHRRNGRRDARDIRRMVADALDAMPGLAETVAGRQVCRVFVRAIVRCQLWGGAPYAGRYADLITNLYTVDRGDTGRALTRHAIRPLAEVMLIRDPIQIATMALSAEHLRRHRRRLHVRRARGDEMIRRFLIRLELIAARRRVRLDWRTGENSLRALTLGRYLTPQRWRGTPRERQIRERVIQVVQTAVREATDDYDRWHDILKRLDDQANNERLRGMALAELDMLIGEQ